VTACCGFWHYQVLHPIATHLGAYCALQVFLPVAWRELLLRPLLAPLLLGRGLPHAAGGGAAAGWLSRGPLGTTLPFLLLVNCVARAHGVFFGSTAPAYWLLSAMYLGEALRCCIICDTGVCVQLGVLC
jgi:hypothetical protein